MCQLFSASVVSENGEAQDGFSPERPHTTASSITLGNRVGCSRLALKKARRRKVLGEVCLLSHGVV